MIPTLLLSLTNTIYHFVVLLELEAKLNALLLPLVEKSAAMIILLPLLDNDDPVIISSPLHYYLMKYTRFNYKSATFAFPCAYYCTSVNSYRNCKTCIQAQISIVTICMLLQPRNINDQLEQLVPLSNIHNNRSWVCETFNTWCNNNTSFKFKDSYIIN